MILNSDARNTRENWEVKIRKLLVVQEDPSIEFKDMLVAENDGLKELAWDGITFEAWLAKTDK